MLTRVINMSLLLALNKAKFQKLILVMKKTSVSSHNLGAFQSPGAPDYRDRSHGNQRGWSSERVPLPGSSSSSRRRHTNAAAMPMTPYYSGRTLPSKWEDAERWICSPVLGPGASRISQCQAPRRPRSKSGPLGPIAYSPAKPGLDCGNFVVKSPFSTGVLLVNSADFDYAGGGGGGGGAHVVRCGKNNVARSAGVVGWTDVLSEASLPSSQDNEKADSPKKEEEKEEEPMNISPVVLRRDMATQMSPNESTHSSPFSSVLLPAATDQLELRDVQVDKRATSTRLSKNRKHRCPTTTKKSLSDVENFTAQGLGSSWDIADAAANDISKLQREEAKISAWENLQKAKAEAAIRKLEMKLEKKRSSSMDRILKKLRIAQMKAEETRNSLSLNQTQTEVHQHQVKLPKSSRKVRSFRKLARLGSFNRGCFTCHAY